MTLPTENMPPPPPPPPPPLLSSQTAGASNRSSRSSLLVRQDGDIETKIDHDATGTVLIQTVMGEKETCIMGNAGAAMLIPAGELDNYQGGQRYE